MAFSHFNLAIRGGERQFSPPSPVVRMPCSFIRSLCGWAGLASAASSSSSSLVAGEQEAQQGGVTGMLSTLTRRHEAGSPPQPLTGQVTSPSLRFLLCNLSPTPLVKLL